MQIRWIQGFCVYLTLLIPNNLSALQVDINGVSLNPEIEGNPCIDITGDYPGFKIVSSEVDTIPQICFDNSGQNHLEIHHVTFVSTKLLSEGEQKANSTNDVAITFSHEFPPGPNGVVTARAYLSGFFSTATGIGVPVRDQISLRGFFSQEGHYDLIADPFSYAVAETIDSGVFQFGAKKKYLISGWRLLRGELSFSFARSGDKLTLPLATGIKIDLGSQFEDRLEVLQTEQEKIKSTEP